MTEEIKSPADAQPEDADAQGGGAPESSEEQAIENSQPSAEEVSGGPQPGVEHASGEGAEPDVHSDDGEEDEEKFEFVEPPSFDVDYKGDCAYTVKVSVPAVNETKQRELLFDELQPEAEVPGFRKGRAPRKLLERRFSKIIRKDVESRLVAEAFQYFVEKEDLNPMGSPNIEGLDEAAEREPEAPLEFSLSFEVAPRVELGKYRGIEIERPVVTLKEDELDETLDNMRRRHSEMKDIEDDVAAKGDHVFIDFKGSVNGEVFPGGEAENYEYILGSERFFPAFDEALLGSKPGDEKTCTVTFPEDYRVEELRQKTADFTIHVRSIQREFVPPLDDELAKRLGAENVEALRTAVGDQLREQSTRQSNRIAELRALEQVVENSSFELPKSLVESITEDLVQDEIRRLTRGRVPMDQIRQMEGDIRERAKKDALRDIKNLVVLNEICDAEGIEVTDEDFDREAETIAADTGLDIELVSRYLQTSDQQNAYFARIQRAKAMRAIMDNAIINDVELPEEELEEDASESRAE